LCETRKQNQWNGKRAHESLRVPQNVTPGLRSGKEVD